MSCNEIICEVEKRRELRRFQCTKCGHRVRDSYNLRHHMLVTLCMHFNCHFSTLQAHTGERPYKCAYCPKAFRRSNLRRQHIEVVHGKRFTSSRRVANEPFRHSPHGSTVEHRPATAHNRKCAVIIGQLSL